MLDFFTHVCIYGFKKPVVISPWRPQQVLDASNLQSEEANTDLIPLHDQKFESIRLCRVYV